MEKKTTKKKKRDSQAREYLFLINNPSEHGVTWESLKDGIMKFKPTYYCISHEEGLKKHTPHYHAFFRCDSPVRFSTLKRRFPACRIEEKKGSASQCRSYVLKCDKWAESEKADTLIKSEEWGEIPKTAKEQKQDMYVKLLEDIENKKSVVEIVRETPKLITKIRDIELMKSKLIEEQYKKVDRDPTNTYLWGPAGCGKTRSIFETYTDICRVTNYARGCFDAYESQDVLLVEEFISSQFPYPLLLNLTDRYVYYLEKRYQNSLLCASKIIFTSNLSWDSQFMDLRMSLKVQPILKAIERRFHNILQMQSDGSIIVHKLTREEELLKGRKVIYKEELEHAEEC